MKSERYRKSIIVQRGHLDDLNHVNNVVFLQWVQDMAGEHWLSKSSKAFNEAYYWVVIDHYIRYTGQAFKGDELVAETYVEKNEGVRSIRVVEFFKDGKMIVRAKTNWCLINRKTNRPARVPKEVDDLFFSE